MTPDDLPGVVFDCNIFFQATRNSNSPAAEALRLLETGAFLLFVSDTILREIRETLTDPEIRAKSPSLTDEVVSAFFDRLSTKTKLIKDVPEQFSYERDPDDAEYVNLALAAGAKYLVSRDKDLLDLTKVDAFRKQYPSLTILDPVGFLQRLRQKGQ
jgi:putative PIN family toxin of toxin-antitoxin system